MEPVQAGAQASGGPEAPAQAAKASWSWRYRPMFSWPFWPTSRARVAELAGMPGRPPVLRFPRTVFAPASLAALVGFYEWSYSLVKPEPPLQAVSRMALARPDAEGNSFFNRIWALHKHALVSSLPSEYANGDISAVHEVQRVREVSYGSRDISPADKPGTFSWRDTRLYVTLEAFLRPRAGLPPAELKDSRGLSVEPPLGAEDPARSAPGPAPAMPPLAAETESIPAPPMRVTATFLVNSPASDWRRPESWLLQRMAVCPEEARASDQSCVLLHGSGAEPRHSWLWWQSWEAQTDGGLVTSGVLGRMNYTGLRGVRDGQPVFAAWAPRPASGIVDWEEPTPADDQVQLVSGPPALRSLGIIFPVYERDGLPTLLATDPSLDEGPRPGELEALATATGGQEEEDEVFSNALFLADEDLEDLEPEDLLFAHDNDDPDNDDW